MQLCTLLAALLNPSGQGNPLQCVAQVLELHMKLRAMGGFECVTMVESR